MRGISLLVLIAGVAFVGYLYQRNVDDTAYTENGEKTTEFVEQQVKDVLEQYQERLDRQAAEQ